eukprot:TRINITY_DN136083_c0_g1_i1.p1 TRINITY_DN136083_c0_g1~~TRINITY_DN136083_c0_g1_i1.p1  ORF type:complete len:508 (-),score=-8.89 TRINITY_DN136083_c0_g1_i1:124-1485(-)
MYIRVPILVVMIGAFTVFSAPVSSVTWNDGKCEISVEPPDPRSPSSSNYPLLLKNLQDNTSDCINNFSSPVYLERHNAIDVYYAKNNSKAFIITLLKPLPENNCHVKIQRVPQLRSLMTSCESYVDCYSCSMASGCFWCNLEDCPVPYCRKSTHTETEWWYKLLQCNSKDDVFDKCPNITPEITSNYNKKVLLPPVGQVMEKNASCLWKLHNVHNQKVTITINRNTVCLMHKKTQSEGRLTITGDNNMVTLSGNTTIQLTDTNITFYYRATEELTSPSLTITIISKREKASNVSLPAIIIVLVLSLIFLYVVVSSIRCCLRKAYAAQIAAELRSREWMDQAGERYDKIMSRSPESVYDPESNKYSQTVCAICLAEFEQNSLIRTLQCSHIFHKGCVEGWINAKIDNVPKCPMCNAELTKDKPPWFVETRREIAGNPENNQNVNPGAIQQQVQG